MKNDPEKHEEQTWVIPRNSLNLKRRKDQWFFVVSGTFVELPIKNIGFAEMLALVASTVHDEEEWMYRHSLQFRWLRFWYRRKKRCEARKLLSQPSTVKE